MSEDKELKVMATVLPALESLEPEERKRVLSWLTQKLGIETLAASARSSKGTSGTSDERLDLSTDTIATILQAKSGTDLIVAAAAHLHFSAAKQKFTRQELTAQMRSAPGYFKETYVNNLTTYLAALCKADRLRLVATDTYAISIKERKELEAKLVDAE